MKAVEIKRGQTVLWFGLEAVTLLEKVRGLMFRRQAFPLVFDVGKEGFIEVHSAFCPEFDVIFLNHKKEVEGIIKNVKSFRHSVGIDKICKFVLEVPAGDSKLVKEGDLLSW